jgi:hypothetical protein
MFPSLTLFSTPQQVMFGYYGMDVFRPKALKLYAGLTGFSLIVDFVVVIARSLILAHASVVFVVFDWILWTFESAAKVNTVFLPALAGSSCVCPRVFFCFCSHFRTYPLLSPILRSTASGPPAHCTAIWSP